MSVNATPAGEAKQLSPPRCRVAHAWMTAERYAQLEHEAHRRGTSPDAFAAELVDYYLRKLAPRRS